jgi:DNA-directed RNA polymerase specialized sigma24 family protein
MDRSALELLFESLSAVDTSIRQCAWRDLFRAYTPMFLGHLRTRYPHLPSADHDDIVSNVFVNATRGLTQLLAAESRHAFFYTIFINAIRQHLRDLNEGRPAIEPEEASARVIEHSRKLSIAVDQEAIELLVQQFRYSADDLGRAIWRVFNVARRDGCNRVKKQLVIDALVEFDRMRRVSNADQTEVPADPMPRGDPETEVDLANATAALKDSFERVMADYRELYPARQEYIDLKIIGQLSNKEIEAALGRTPGATREFLSSCRLTFRKVLSRLCGEHALEAAEELL